MKEKYPLLRIIVAALPLMAYIGRFQQALWLGGQTCLALWAVALFFKMTWPLFPPGVRRMAMIMGILAVVLSGFYLLDYPVIAGASLYLLLPRDTEEKMAWKPYVRRWAGHGLGFWILLAALGLCHEFFGHMLDLRLFRQPAGSLLVMAFAALFWQGQPEAAGKAQPV